MKRNKILFLSITLLLTYAYSAALIFNELMYDPDGGDTDHEWIELLNETNSTVDLTGWKFFEANVNHGLSAYQGSLTIPIGGYAIIAADPQVFLQDNPTYQGSIIKSSFSLSNSGEYLAMKNSSGAIQDSLTYIPSLGGQDDGTTLSFLGGAWIRGEKSPGEANSASNAPLTSSSGSSNKSTSSSNSPSNSNNEIATLPAAVNITSSDLMVHTVNEKVVLAGADAEFSARASIAGKKIAEDSMFVWSFGDGGTKIGRSVGYHYQYPGMYLATVEVSADGAVATSKIRVKVIDPEITISNVNGEIGKNYIEISNSSAYEVDISNWKIALNRVQYQIPKNTFIMGKQKVRFAGNALGFGSTTINQDTLIQLLYPNYTEMMRYTASTTINQTKDKVKNEPSFNTQLQNTFQVKPESKKKLIHENISKSQPLIDSTSTPKTNNGISGWLKKFLEKL